MYKFNCIHVNWVIFGDTVGNHPPPLTRKGEGGGDKRREIMSSSVQDGEKTICECSKAKQKYSKRKGTEESDN